MKESRSDPFVDRRFASRVSQDLVGPGSAVLYGTVAVSIVFFNKAVLSVHKFSESNVMLLLQLCSERLEGRRSWSVAGWVSVLMPRCLHRLMKLFSWCSITTKDDLASHVSAAGGSLSQHLWRCRDGIVCFYYTVQSASRGVLIII